MSAPQSTVHVCSGVRLDARYVNSIYFANRAAQEAYFAGKVKATFSACTYLRKSWPLQLQATMEQAKAWNYLYFQNGSGKVYYYFINQIEYKNDSSIILHLELDVLQTYLFDFTLQRSFIERQHTTSDNVGEHTIDEGLDVGELTNNKVQHFGNYRLCIMVMCSINPNSATQTAANQRALPYMYNGVFSGVKIWAIHPDKWQAWGNQIETLDELGVTDSILAMWMYPMSMVKLPDGVGWMDEDIAVPVEAAYSEDESLISWSLGTPPDDVNGYTPKNNKLLCYPYCFAYATDNQGGSAVYRYERFKNRTCLFSMSGSLSPDGGMHMTPHDYNGVSMNYLEGMTLSGYPTCAWDSDTYKLWLAQNQNQMRNNNTLSGGKILAGAAIALGGAAASATGVGTIPGVGGIATGAGMVVSGITDIASQLAQKHDRDIEPPQARGNFSSSVNITNDEHCFTFYHKSCTAETAKTIDDFFTMFGYKINRVLTPNINARPAFTYIKTKGCNLQGNMCNEDILKVCSIFDNGITWWKDGNKIGDYTQDNTV